MKIDAHQHFWKLSRGDYGWLTRESHGVIYRDFMPDMLAPLLKQQSIDRTILVQAAPTDAETGYLLDIANSVPFVAGVVGWAALDAPDAAGTIARLAKNGRLLGLRPMLQDIVDDEWILSAGVAPALAAMEEHGLRFDALIKPRQLGAIRCLLASHPDLPLVIDHGAKPDIASGLLETWAAEIRQIARESAACCKLSGLVTEAGQAWSLDSLKPVLDVLLESFGPSRLMWGSDWPVVNEIAGYSEWHDAAVALTVHLAPNDRDAIFGETAARFYGVSG